MRSWRALLPFRKAATPAAADVETAAIAERKKTPAARRRHKFQAAEWTAGNGHPRCRLCGDEPTTDGMCEGTAMFRKSALVALETEDAELTRLLVHLEEDDLPRFAEDDPRRAPIVDVRAELIARHAEVGTLLAKARRLHGRRRVDGLRVSIENRRGSKRHWYDAGHDRHGTTTIQAPGGYGYIRETLGADGEHVDCLLGPLATSDKIPSCPVVIIAIRTPPDFRAMDEDKVLLGFPTVAEARAEFVKHYDNPKFIGRVSVMSWDEFKAAVRKTATAPGLIEGGRVVEEPAPGRTGRLLLFKKAQTGAVKVPEKDVAGQLGGYHDVLGKAVDAVAKAFPGEAVAGRLKETGGLATQLGAEAGEIAETPDVASIRLTLKTLADEKLALGKLARVFQVRETKDFLERPTGAGYRAVHCTIEVEGRPVEVQLRTPNQTTWADYVHDIAYRTHGQATTPELRQYLTAMSAYAAGLDGGAEGTNGTAVPECPPDVEAKFGPMDLEQL